jgi:magnesium-transporting ATPase (P-type)
MRRPPRPPDEPLLTPFMIWRVVFVGTLLLLGAGLLFLEQKANEGTSLAFARTAAVNAMVVGEIFYLLNARFHVAPALTREGLFGSRPVWLTIAACAILQLVFTHAPFMNTLFGTAPLDLETWARCLAVGVTVFVAVELEKLVLRVRAEKSGRRIA